ncbi:hypothetical protein [Bacillus sp. OTU530]|uniref:hypothetical protein n=1 Tax=Bacillus sp. OTU530 TaxID=3043862 RepID=UPI00313EF473
MDFRIIRDAAGKAIGLERVHGGTTIALILTILLAPFIFLLFSGAIMNATYYHWSFLTKLFIVFTIILCVLSKRGSKGRYGSSLLVSFLLFPYMIITPLFLLAPFGFLVEQTSLGDYLVGETNKSHLLPSYLFFGLAPLFVVGITRGLLSFFAAWSDGSGEKKKQKRVQEMKPMEEVKERRLTMLARAEKEIEKRNRRS